MKIGFIGAGKVGFSLGKFLVEGKVTVTGYYSRHRESAQEAAKFTNTRCYTELQQIIADSDVLFLTVPDGEIPLVYNQMKGYEIRNKQICHCSGALSLAEAFPDIEDHGAQGFSIHPLFPISSKYETYRELADAFFCLEAAKESKELQEWQELLRCLGVRYRTLASENKAKYHAACAISSNLVCALVQQSLDLLKECGFDEKEGLQALKPLIQSNVHHILDKGPVEALTGPMERGDEITIEKHMKCMGMQEKDLYRAVSLKLMEMAMQKHSERDYSKIREILCEENLGKSVQP